MSEQRQKAVPDTSDVDEDYEEFLQLLAQRVKTFRAKRNLTLRQMVVDHGYHDSGYRRIEREGVGGILSLMRLCKAFETSLSELLDGLGDYNKAPMHEIKQRVEREEEEVLNHSGKQK